MQLLAVADARSNGVKVVHEFCPQLNQKDRIIEALGAVRHIPRVDDESLSRYYKYLTEHLRFPFTAHYPVPTTLLEEVQYLGDGFDGIFCKTRKGKYELNLPLIELYMPENSFRFQLIEDYWHWFWNWR